MPRSQFVITVLFSLCTTVSAEIPFYSLTDLGPQGAVTISKEGLTVAGWQFQNGQQIAQQFLPQQQSLGTLGGISSQAFAAHGQRIVGVSATVDDSQNGFVFENGQMTALQGLSTAAAINADDICGGLLCLISGERVEFPTLGGSTPGSSINALNEKGNAVGVSRTASGEFHCTFWPVEGGAVDCSGTTFSIARDINSSNVIVGDTGGEGFFYFFSSMLLHPLAGFQHSTALSINDLHLTVGQSWSAVSGAFHSADAATVWENGIAVDLQTRLVNAGQYKLIRAVGIDNDNRIVAEASVNGQIRSVLLTPVLNAVAAWYYWKYDISRYYVERFDRWKKIIAQYYFQRRAGR